VKEMLNAAFIANESKSLVDEEACDSPRWHGVLRCASSLGNNPRRSMDRW
jgi:hypothetical protein